LADCKCEERQLYIKHQTRRDFMNDLS